MAEAIKTTREITTTEDVYTLTLSAEEHAWLVSLTGKQLYGAGDGANGRVYDALMAPTAQADDTYEYEGVTYDLKAKYRDPSGDMWAFTGAYDGSGMPLFSCTEPDVGDAYQNWTLPVLVSHYNYGSRLTKI